MKLLRYEREGKVGVGILDEGSILPLDWEGDTARLIAERGTEGISSLVKGSGERLDMVGARIMAPIQRPGKIICLGRNYAAHAEESGMSVPDEPIIFPKATSSVIGTGDPIIHHSICSRVDHEVELAVVIGSKSWKTGRADAMEKVFGYTVLNDVSARNMQIKDIELRNPWFRSKSLDTFCPMGPWVVTREEIDDPQELDLECRVNGDTRQRGNTRDMIFPVEELIEFISSHMTLEPGDIISTGTPEGISAIVPGDVVDCQVQGVGTISNTVIPDPDR